MNNATTLSFQHLMNGHVADQMHAFFSSRETLMTYHTGPGAMRRKRNAASPMTNRRHTFLVRSSRQKKRSSRFTKKGDTYDNDHLISRASQ